jgi:hypothetical protein
MSGDFDESKSVSFVSRDKAVIRMEVDLNPVSFTLSNLSSSIFCFESLTAQSSIVWGVVG